MDNGAELDKLTYIISHDLQEPLRMIKSYVQLLNKKYNDKLDEEAKEYIQFAVDGTNRLKLMMDDLLEYSRLGRNGIEVQPVKLKEISESIVRSFKKKYAHGNYSITFGFDDTQEITADKALTSKLLHNFIDNALKFNISHSKSLNIEIGAEDEKDEWILSVKDDGIGIDKQYHEKIFLIFQKMSSNGEYSGSGMGLAICEKIAKLHRGKIWVDSELNKGAAFYYTIPKKITG
jgi:chemotaxis family two-component system sensor kinase Cph1